jgi:uncharacterized protein (PEP-CTERM system associated)
MLSGKATKAIRSAATQKQIALGAGLICSMLPVFAGEWEITPTIAVSETLTDNVYLSDTHAQSALVSDITPGIRIDGSGGRAKLHLDYQMHNLFYTVDPSRNNQTQNSLNAFGTLEAVENWFFIDASGFISQQSLSPFGAISTFGGVSTNVNSNVSETSTYQLSPYIRGSFGRFADYQLRYLTSKTTSKSSLASNYDTQEVLGRLQGETGLSSLSWSIDASRLTTRYDLAVRSNEADRVRGVLTYQIDPQFRASLIGGREANNYVSLDKQSNTTRGAGFEWAPTERTHMAFSREERFFGPSNTFDFSHRTALTAWRMSASKDATNQQNPLALNLGTNYNLWYTIISSQNPSLSPQETAALVNLFLLANGISPDAQAQVGFLANQTVLQQLRQISFAVLGARNTVTFTVMQNETENLRPVNIQGVVVESGPIQNNVNQIGTSVNWSHQLSATSSLIATIARWHSKGIKTNTLETKQQMISLNFLTSLGPKTHAGMGARRTTFDGTTSYSEMALIATLNHEF